MNSLDNYLKENMSVAIAGHVRPDGDCVGSCLAVYHYILDGYPSIDLHLYLDPIPEKFECLSKSDVIEDATDVDKAFDLFIVLDCGDLGRLGQAAPLFEKAAETICIDHHKTNQNFADHNYVFPNASSASELVYDLMDKTKLTKEISECLYLGIAHDTGVFQYSCTSSHTMEIAGELMNQGINYPKLIDETYYIKSFAQQKIWGKAMLDSQLYLDGKCIFSMITQKDMDAYGVTSKDLDGIVSNLRSTTGVEVSIFMYETADGYKLSLRSASYVDVASIAAAYGGGGHVRAAGASFKGDIEEILNQLLAMIGEQL